MSAIETIIRDTNIEFSNAKRDGKLEASEVIHIALSVSKKVFVLANLSDTEKDAMVYLSLKKGLAAAGGLAGLPAFAALPAPALEVVEEQLIKAGLTATHVVRKALPALFAPVKKILLGCLPYCSQIATVLDPKDTAVVQEALALVTPVPSVEATQVSETQSVEAPVVIVVEDTPLPNTLDTAPNPAPSQ